MFHKKMLFDSFYVFSNLIYYQFFSMKNIFLQLRYFQHFCNYSKRRVSIYLIKHNFFWFQKFQELYFLQYIITLLLFRIFI